MKSLFGDNRIANLLQLLRQTPAAAVSTLASKLEVSERTVRNDIKQLNDALDGCAAVEGTQGKYMLRIFDAERFQKVFAALSESDDFLNSSRNRMDYIFGKLMRSEKPLLTDELAYEMNVGRTTLMSDLKKLRGEIEPYQLQIIGKTSKGLMLRGLESDIRKYVIDQSFQQIYRAYPLDPEIREAVSRTFAQNAFEKSVQNSFEQFLILMLDRFLTGHYIGTLSAQYYNLAVRPEFAVVDGLVDSIAGLRVENPMLDDLKGKYPLAYQMAGIAARVVRQDYGLTVTEAERGYLASYFGVFLEESENRKRQTFRVAVVCGTGRVTARLVAAQLKKVLDSAAELTLLADDKATHDTLNAFDIVLTTVELSCACDRPVIRIHEIFNEQELMHKIEKARYWDQVDVPMLDNNWFVMTGLLDDSRFFKLDGMASYDAAVAHMAASLTRDGQVDEGFHDRIRRREQKGTMVFDHAVAIPHSVQYAGDKLVLAIGVFHEPVRYQDHEIRVVFLLGLPRQTNEEEGLLIRVYDEIISITQDSGLLDKLAQSDSFPDLLRALYRQAGE